MALYRIKTDSPWGGAGGYTTVGLILNLDAGNSLSYPGSGTTWTDLSGINNASLNGAVYSSFGGGSIEFDGTNDYVDLGGKTYIGSGEIETGEADGNYTLEAWIYVRSSQGTNLDADSIVGSTSTYGVGMQVAISGGFPRINYGARGTSNFYSSTFSYNTWTDLSGNGNNGTLVGGVGYSADNGGVLTFDGVDDRIECGTFSLSFLTVSTWVYKTSSATNQGICRKQNGWAVSQYNGTLQVAPGTSWTFYNTGYTIPLNTWVNIVYAYSGTGTTGSQTVYINGSSIYSSTAGSGAITSNSNTVRIGFDDNNWWWGGRIAQTQIYNRALTAAEVTQNYNALKGRYGL